MAVQGLDLVLSEPTDVTEQWEEWGANCGPTAIAALTNRQVHEVRKVVERVACGDRKKGRSGKWAGYMNAGHLATALSEFGYTTRRRNFQKGEGSWPSKGLAMIQIEGPWCEPPAKPTARYRYTHTVAVVDTGPVHGALIYDGNAEGWAKAEWWGKWAMDKLVEDVKRATGWYIMMTLEV